MIKLKNISLILAVVFIVSTLIATPLEIGHRTLLPTYFNYTEDEVAPLYRFDSSKEMNREELAQWDKIAYHLIFQQEQEENSSRIYAYLYTAQRDAAYLSYNIKQKFEGSLGPISQKVLAEFFPQLRTQDQAGDTYSNLLADIVIAKVKARMHEDQRSTRLYPQKQGESYWVGDKQPFYGQSTGSWKTWFLASGDQFRLPPPPPYDSPEWKKQLEIVREACEHATNAQKQTILYWAGIGPGEISQNQGQTGDWRKIANDYMWNQSVPLAKLLLVRSTLAMGLADTSIAVFDSKYTYWVKRPSMRDSRIKPYLPLPNHPSYPSGHSTISNAAATILTYFFPEHERQWEQLAHDAGLSRIWCGIHFPLDHQAGAALGKEVGQTVIEAVKVPGKK